MVQGMFGLERGIKVESQRQINKVKAESVEAEEVSDCVFVVKYLYNNDQCYLL